MDELNLKIISILKKLDYTICDNLKTLNKDLIVEKEEIFIVVRLLNKKQSEIVSKFEIESFKNDLEKEYNLKGYLITNTKFDLDYSNNLYIYNGRIRLFDKNEIERLSK